MPSWPGTPGRRPGPTTAEPGTKPRRENSPGNPALYFREDGSFRVFDPSNPLLAKTPGGTRDRPHGEKPGENPGGVLSEKDLWQGRPGRTEGMRRDICRWQRRSAPPQGPDTPDALTAFTKAMSQALGSEVEFPGPVRLPGKRGGDARHTGRNLTVPLHQAGAGTLRAASMAHLITWMWEEHRVRPAWPRNQGRNQGKNPGGRPR